MKMQKYFSNDYDYLNEGGSTMRKFSRIFVVMLSLFLLSSCSTYKVKPVPFKSPTTFPNATHVGQAVVGAKAFVEPKEAKEAFGFDIRGAGMLPVQVVFDNLGPHPLEINGQQSFLEDQSGNLWPVLNRNVAYERATKYSTTQNIVKEGAYSGMLGAAAGSIIGAAVGIVTGENVATAAGKGAAVGAAAGATIGGAVGAQSDDPRRAITSDLREKSLENKAVEPHSIAHGFLFFPAEAETARKLRLQLIEKDTGKVHVVLFEF
jgi:hypothetical protein